MSFEPVLVPVSPILLTEIAPCCTRLLLTVHHNNHVRYFATFCITSGTYTTIGLIIAWCLFTFRLSICDSEIFHLFQMRTTLDRRLRRQLESRCSWLSVNVAVFWDHTSSSSRKGPDTCMSKASVHFCLHVCLNISLPQQRFCQ